MEAKNIQVIFFDLGRVIVNFDHLQIAQKLLASQKRKDHPDPRILFDRLFDPVQGLCCAFDAGKISPLAFYTELCREYDLEISFEFFAATWNEIFSENTDVTRMIRELSKHVRLFLLSNTNPLHFEYIRATFPVLDLFEGFVLSYEIGVCKPNQGIYEAALTQAGVRGNQAIYTDDILEYTQAAENLGIHGIHFTSANSLETELERIIPFRFKKDK